MAELQGLAVADEPLELFGGTLRDIGIGDAVADDELAALVPGLDVEDVAQGIAEAREEAPARARGTRAHSRQTGSTASTKQFDTGWNARSKEAVGEGGEVAHVALDERYVEALALRDEAVLLELLGAVVEDRDPRARRREDRSLLPAPRGEAEDASALDLAVPFARHGDSRP